METRFVCLIAAYLASCFFFVTTCFSQVDTTFIYRPGTPYGPLDLRIAKSPTNYYYLQDGTFSFRESSPGSRTNTYFDMTAWDSSPYREGQLREKTGSGDNFVMNYRLLIPEDYNAGYNSGYPIVLVLHGFGERGNCEENTCYHADRSWSPVTNSPPAPTDPDFELLNNDHQLLHGGGKHLSGVQRAAGRLPDDPSLDSRCFPGFVLFPQCLNGWDPGSVQDAIRILRLIIKRYNIDEDRVYVEGISNGGHGLYEALKRAPWLFASAIAMSAIDDASVTNQGLSGTIAHIPLWIVQGGMDINPRPGRTMRYIQQFRGAGAEVRYTLYPELGHGTWNKVFAEPDFFTWMLGRRKSDIHSFEGSSFVCSEQGTRLELAKGFHAYQWEFNGSIVSGADSAVFYAKTPGRYRARFSRVKNPTEAQWNEWSKPLELKAADPPVANIRQTGTALLPDLNGEVNLRMESDESHSRYYWYRNGTLLNLPGDEDDTLKAITVTPNAGNGAYTLVVSDYGCRSAPSNPLHAFFNNSAPVNIAAPTGFAGLSTSPAENALTWTDASQNEGGFEIWRRKRLNDSNWGPWQMAGIAPANATTIDDAGLEPTATYQYKIRAVSNTGRSAYTPSAANTGIVVETEPDDEPPTVPTGLRAWTAGVERFHLSWRPSTDNTRIREYVILVNGDLVSTGSPDTTFLLEGLSVNRDYTIRVKSMDLSRNLSAESDPIKVSTYFAGLYYEHTTGSWPELDSIDWSWAEFTGKVGRFTLSPKTQEDYYNFSFDGYLLITQTGNYSFRTTSSDGSMLWIDNKRVVNNDGIHDVKTVTGSSMSLTKGPHRIYLRYFEYIAEDSLSVEYRGPDTGNQWKEVSYEVLKSDPNIVTSVEGDNGPESSFIVDVYPNPTTGAEIRVTVGTVLPTPVRVRMLDLTGRSLFDQVYQAEEAVQGVTIMPYGAIGGGLYLVIVEQGGISVREKIIVRR